MKHVIKNFSDRHEIEVSTVSTDLIKKYGAHVSLCAASNNLRFQHDLTAAQARQMAQALLDCADEAEAIAQEAA